MGQIWAFPEGVDAGCGHWRAKQFHGVAARAAAAAAAALPVGGFPGQKFPISFIPASSWKGGLPNLGCSPRGKLPGKGFLPGSSLKGVGTVDPRGGGDCWDYLQVVQMNSRELDPGFGLEGAWSLVPPPLPRAGNLSLGQATPSPIQPDPGHCQGWGVGNSLRKGEKLLYLRESLREEPMPRDVQQHTWPCRTLVVLQLSGISVWRGRSGPRAGG